MPMPKRILVGTRNGKRTINWPMILSLGLMVGVVAGASGVGTWFLLTNEFSLFAVVFPVFMSIGWFWGTAIRRSFLIPIEQLPSLDQSGEGL